MRIFRCAFFIFAGVVATVALSFDFGYFALKDPPLGGVGGIQHTVCIDGNTMTCDRETQDFIVSVLRQNPMRVVRTIVGTGK